jgi:hypothetical protein
MSTKPESMPPHAPGPWAINGRFIGPADSIFNDLDNAVCMTPDRSKGSQYETPTRQDTANARVIAAAPEMLVALKWLHENAVLLAKHAERTGFDYIIPTDALKFTRAIIAKAEADSVFSKTPEYRMASAAPELLGSLTALLQECDRGKVEDEETLEAIASARGAVARATNGTYSALTEAAQAMLDSLSELLVVLDTDALDPRTEEVWKWAHDAVDKALGNEILSARMEKANARYNASVATGGTEQEIDAAHKVMLTEGSAARLAELKKNRVAPLLPATPPSKKTR